MGQPFQMTRRQALQNSACGFGSLALAGLLEKSASATIGNPLHAKQPHFAPRAKRIIFLFMQGGPSQVDTFDHKPLLAIRNGQQHAFDDARTIAKARTRATPQTLMKSPWRFRQFGECGQWVSDLFPEMSKHVDKMCMVHSIHTEGVAHGPATLFLHCGATNLVRPSMGAWVTYGLGTECDDLPGFISICPSAGNGGARNFGNSFLPPIYQGTTIGSVGAPVRDAKIRDLVNDRFDTSQQRRQFELLRSINRQQRGHRRSDEALDAVINSFELAWRMQNNAPNILELSDESAATLAMYGINERPTDNFGRECLMARRLAEAGVRFIQVTYGDNTANPAWDQHTDLPKHAEHARRVDKPIAGLLADLEQRGMLDDTLVWWGSEFGRTPYSQNEGTGRDHNPGGFTIWLAGGGTKRGVSIGRTDEFGHRAVENKIHMHDLHATLLYLLGIDHERLTYEYSGRNFRLTDVHGHVAHDVVNS